MEALIHLIQLVLTPAMLVGLLLGIAAAFIVGWLTPAGTDPTFGQAALVVLCLIAGGIYSGVAAKKHRREPNP
jgi:hypothetical protein